MNAVDTNVFVYALDVDEPIKQKPPAVSPSHHQGQRTLRHTDLRL